MSRFTAVLVAAIAAPHGSATAAQATPPPASRQPEYRSTFQDYRSFKDQAVASWRDVNREVARIGGHAGSLKSGDEASTPPANAPKNAPAAPPVSAHPAHR